MRIHPRWWCKWAYKMPKFNSEKIKMSIQMNYIVMFFFVFFFAFTNGWFTYVINLNLPSPFVLIPHLCKYNDDHASVKMWTMTDINNYYIYYNNNEIMNWYQYSQLCFRHWTRLVFGLSWPISGPGSDSLEPRAWKYRGNDIFIKLITCW